MLLQFYFSCLACCSIEAFDLLGFEKITLLPSYPFSILLNMVCSVRRRSAAAVLCDCRAAAERARIFQNTQTPAAAGPS